MGKQNGHNPDETANPPSEQELTIKITLHIDTGNTIYEEFTDWGKFFEFIRRYTTDPNATQAILDKISPKRPKS